MVKCRARNIKLQGDRIPVESRTLKQQRLKRIQQLPKFKGYGMSKPVMTIVFGLACVALAFASGKTFLGMGFAMLAIGSIGYGAGSMMNSDCPQIPKQ